MPSPLLRTLAMVLLVLATFSPGAHGQARRSKPAPKAKPEAGSKADPAEYPLSMSKAIACESVAGFDDFVRRPTPSLTADEKLLVYYEPRHFATEKVGEKYQAHFVQDVRVRRRDRKEPLWSKDKIVDFVAKSDAPSPQVFLTNTIALKGCEPGEYDLDITLHDEVGKGPTATQTLRFTIVAAKEPADDEP